MGFILGLVVNDNLAAFRGYADIIRVVDEKAPSVVHLNNKAIEWTRSRKFSHGGAEHGIKLWTRNPLSTVHI